MGEEHSGVRQIWDQILGFLLRQVILGKLLHFLEPWFYHLQNGDTIYSS
jgi:hypothetical protein